MSNRLHFAVRIIFMILFFSSFLHSAEEDLTVEQEQMLSELPLDLQASVRLKMIQQKQIATDIDQIQREAITRTTRPEKRKLTPEEQEEQRERAYSLVYGYDLFASSPTTFAPATDIPIPLDYVLGPGDIISVNLFGTSSLDPQNDITINRDASIEIPGMRPIGVGGLTLQEARKLINKRVSTEFLGATASVSVTELRSMQIFVLGDAYMPGSYTVSSLSNISHAIYVAGGVSEMGSLRNIQLKRRGKLIQTYDLYDLLLKGDTSKDLRLLPGDVLFIPIIKNKARILGSVRRPALYEVKEDTTLGDLLELSAGLKSESLPSSVELNRVNIEEARREILKIDIRSKDNLSMLVKDGDIVNIPSITDLNEISITLTGQFRFPGTYSVRNGEKLSHLLERAGGFTESAYLYGTVFTRKSVAAMENASFQKTADDMETAIASALIAGRLASGDITAVSAFIQNLRQTRSPGRLVVDIDPINIARDPEKDFYLEAGDRIHLPMRTNSITVVGDVYSPTTLPFKSSQRVKDYVKQSGGFRWGADKNSSFLILPDGQARNISSGIWKFSKNEVAPGSTIVVPKSTRPFDWLMLTESISPILANLATSAAALAAIDD